jgi:hypothetical protein
MTTTNPPAHIPFAQLRQFITVAMVRLGLPEATLGLR